MQFYASNKAFLRGRGLDSEWGGWVDVGGTADKPIVTGELRALRGSFSLIGKTFGLERGLVRFDGNPKIDPALDLRFTRTGETQVSVVVTGRVSDPKIELASDPSMPQSEIVSSLLFGKGSGKLTPLEAVQLADALATLAGKSGSAGIAERIRDALGLDVLTVGEGTPGSAIPQVSAGRYLTDKVFVGVEPPTGKGSGAVNVQVDVTPNITLETEVGAGAQGSVGLNWKHNY